ncbi:unnamed protein product [Prunus armeniaca]|uniref:Uncharacterized protein n=1 Tax=Prunus armeniaca TaxID=36596 RepID=A0A6J5XXT4_PRUAR|nr:unnamed protein product [Prunus armeniaca]
MYDKPGSCPLLHSSPPSVLTTRTLLGPDEETRTLWHCLNPQPTHRVARVCSCYGVYASAGSTPSEHRPPPASMVLRWRPVLRMTTQMAERPHRSPCPTVTPAGWVPPRTK